MQERKRRILETSTVALIPAALVLLQAGGLFRTDATRLGLGLPIDDAYIFIQYGKNIAAGHGFSFNPGEISFGCTSLAWPALLAVLFKVVPFLSHETVSFWTGTSGLAASASLSGVLVMRKTSSLAAGLFSGLVISLSPLLLMNGVSGMETGLSFFLLALLSWLLLAEKPRPVTAGLVAGLLTLNRPEAAYFPAGVLAAWVMLAAVRGEKPRFARTLEFALAWAVLAVPASLWIYSHIGFVLPGTYTGKILSADPSALDRGVLERLNQAASSLVGGWLSLGATLRVLAFLIGGGALAEVLAALMRSRSTAGGWPAAGRITLFGFLFLPAAYGLAFPVGPPFGGYYARYIAPVMIAASILGTLGIITAARAAAEKWGPLRSVGPPAAAAALLCGLIYLVWLWSFQMKDAQKVFANEVRLNTGPRARAAQWIRKNTPRDARVMVGYTGLGVVGEKGDRYVLDLGALINPDIFSYYEKAGKRPKEKWKAAVRYMRDKGADYYVTFDMPQSYKKVADPADTPGFIEAALLKEKEGTYGKFGKVIIFRISDPDSAP